MTQKQRAFFSWFYMGVTALTFLAIAGIVIFELYIRWVVNQNYSALAPNALLGLTLLLGAELIGLVWLSRS